MGNVSEWVIAQKYPRRNLHKKRFRESFLWPKYELCCLQMRISTNNTYLKALSYPAKNRHSVLKLACRKTTPMNINPQWMIPCLKCSRERSLIAIALRRKILYSSHKNVEHSPKPLVIVKHICTPYAAQSPNRFGETVGNCWEVIGVATMADPESLNGNAIIKNEHI